LIAALLLLFCAPAAAYRPFLTEDATTASHRRPELELSWDRWRGKDRSETDRFLTVVNYGLTKRLELSLETSWWEQRPTGGPQGSGFGDVTLANKLRLLDETEGRPAVLLRSSVKFENADAGSGLGSGTTDGAAYLALTKTLGPLTLHAALGAIRTGGPMSQGARRWLYDYGVAADWALHGRLRPIVELAGTRGSADDGSPDPAAAGGGFIIPVAEGVNADLIGRKGLSRTAADWQATAGLSFAF
jgi:hypothetical protein